MSSHRRRHLLLLLNFGLSILLEIFRAWILKKDSGSLTMSVVKLAPKNWWDFRK